MSGRGSFTNRPPERRDPARAGATGGAFALPADFGQRFALRILALFFIVNGVNHFFAPELYLQLMPPALPAHQVLVWSSGLLMLLGGFGVLLRPVRRASGWLLIAVIIAVTPANIAVALHPERLPDYAPWIHVARLPLQLLIIGWIWWSTRPEPDSTTAGA